MPTRLVSQNEPVLLDSRYQPAATCLVCGGQIESGAGLTALLGERTLRFKCAGCLTRFEAEPERYLAGHPTSCCDDRSHDHSPASEWACDR